MVLFNYSTRELTAKIVYYGPGLCGKTTNLQFIYESLPDNVKKGKMLSLATKTDRTLFFDFLPIEIGPIRGMKTRLQLYTVPGQVFYNSTRKLVLKGADGVVFVADSQSKMLEANVESYKNLEDNLREMGIRIDEIPLVMQFNKRDLPNLASVEEMNTQINRHNAPFYEAVATTGIGVEDTLKAVTKLVLNNLATKYKLEGAPAGAEAEAPVTAAAPRPAPRPAAPRPAPVAARPVAPPEDLALDALDADAGPTSIPLPPSARRPARPEPAAPAPRAAAARAARPAVEEIIDLEEEIDLPGLEVSEQGSVDLGEDLLQELEEETLPLAAPAAGRGAPPATRPAPAERRAGPRAVRHGSGSEEPIDLDDPIDLGEEWDPTGSGTAEAGAPGAPIDVGPLTPGQEQSVEVPIAATVNGRPVRFSLRISIRLSR
jgi:signal recognition particle receptor subunit beta